MRCESLLRVFRCLSCVYVAVILSVLRDSILLHTACFHICVCVCVCARVGVSVCVCMFVCTYACVCVCVCVCERAKRGRLSVCGVRAEFPRFMGLGSMINTPITKQEEIYVTMGLHFPGGTPGVASFLSIYLSPRVKEEQHRYIPTLRHTGNTL